MATCKSCGQPQPLIYCGHCGEQRLTVADRRVVHIVSEFFENLTSANSRIVQSIKLLLISPGVAIANFNEGRRTAYMRPIPLFLIANLIFLMLAGLTDFNVNFVDQFKMQFYSEYIQDWLRGRINASGLESADFVAQYNALVVVLARSLIILCVPLLAILTPLLFLGLTVRPLLADHLIFSLYLYSGVMVWGTIIANGADLLGWLAQPMGLSGWVSTVMTFIIVPGLLYYLFVALRDGFAMTKLAAAWRTPLLFIMLFVSLMCFRFVQLIVTMAVMTTPNNIWG